MSSSMAPRTVEQAAEEFFALAKMFPDAENREVEQMRLAVKRYGDRDVFFEDDELIACIDETAARLWDLMMGQRMVVPLETLQHQDLLQGTESAAA